MKNKLVTIMTGAALIAAMLAGCGGEAQTAAPAKSTETQTEEAAGNSTQESTASGEQYKVYLVTMDQMDQHWVNVDAGCRKAVAELGNVDYQWLAPDVKDDAKQIECINNAVAGGANAILLAANGPDAVTAVLEEATSAGVKIIYVDSAAAYDGEVTFATDNEAAGKTAGETMLAKLQEKGITSGKIGIVNVNAATASCVDRETGFRSAFEGTDFELLETQYGEGDAAKSKDIAANYITSGCVGLFGCNEGSTTGVGNAIQEAGGEVTGVGFDKSDTILGLISDGYLLATMAQNPDVMGYEGIKAAAEVLGGASLGGEVKDTGVSVITKDSM